MTCAWLHLAEVVSLETDWVSRLDVEGSCRDLFSHRPKIRDMMIGERQENKRRDEVYEFIVQSQKFILGYLFGRWVI